MKRIASLTISAILLLTLFACAVDTAPENLSPPGDTNPPTAPATDIAPPDNPQETLSVNTPETGTEDPLPPTPFELAGMPIAFEHTGGDDYAGFNAPHVFKLTLYDPMFRDFATYLGFTVDEFHSRLEEAFGDWWDELSRDTLTGRANLFGLIIEFDIPNEIVAESLQKHNEICEDFAMLDEAEGWYGNAEYFRGRKFTDTEIEALLSRDAATVLEHFANDYAIVIEDRAYTPFWLYFHTPEDYEKAGITAEMLEQKLDLFGDFNLTAEAARAFEAKLSEFIGESVSLERRLAD
jgi:hypothetical protein